MARLKSPLFSFGAIGRLGKRLTVTRRLSGPAWLLRGRPADPRTDLQLTWRTMWMMAAGFWHQLSAAEQSEWERAGTIRGMTGFAWYMSQALRPNPGIYLPLAGGTMAGDIDMDGHQVTDLVDPTANQEAATKKYHDDNLPAGGYTEGCRAYHNIDQAIPSGVVWVVPALNSTEYDTDDMHDDAVNNERITFKTAGKYLVNVQFKWDIDATGRRIIGIRNQAGDIISVIEAAVPGANTFNMICTTITNVSINDWVEVIAFQNTGGALAALYNANTNLYFMAQRIG